MNVCFLINSISSLRDTHNCVRIHEFFSLLVIDSGQVKNESKERANTIRINAHV